MRLTLTIALLVFMLSLPPLIPQWTTPATLVTIAFELACLLGLIGMWTQGRARATAFRCLGAGVFALFATYFIVELARNGWSLPAHRSRASSGNALIGLLVYGLPGLIYAIVGDRFLRNGESPDEHAFTEDFEDDDEH